MKSTPLLAAGALAAAVLAIAFAVHQANRHSEETADLRKQLEQAQAQVAAVPVSTPAASGDSPAPPPSPSAKSTAAAPAVESPAAAPSAPAAPEAEPWLAQFDRAMDREFARIEEREKSCQDPAELAVLAELKTALSDLDQTWTDMDAGEKSATEREALADQARNQMLAVMRLAAADRNLRLARVAHALGVADAAALDRFIADIDQVYRDTDLDWATLFNRGF